MGDRELGGLLPIVLLLRAQPPQPHLLPLRNGGLRGETAKNHLPGRIDPMPRQSGTSAQFYRSSPTQPDYREQSPSDLSSSSFRSATNLSEDVLLAAQAARQQRSG